MANRSTVSNRCGRQGHESCASASDGLRSMSPFPFSRAGRYRRIRSRRFSAESQMRVMERKLSKCTLAWNARVSVALAK
jgi:hypothetical protein